MIIDFHAHILPGIDDGAKDVTMSLAILEKELSDGVGMVIATPHYYPDEQSISDFIAKREEAYTQLVQDTQEKHIPSIKLGAEVYFSPLLIHQSNLHDLCISGTDYLLLELPYEELTPKLIDEIKRFIFSANVTPIIAHAERYLMFTSFESLEEILELDVLGQVNASSIADSHSRKNAFRLIKNNYIHVIGSDAHNMTSRPAEMKDAEKILSRKISRTIYSKFMNNAKMILDNIDIDEIY